MEAAQLYAFGRHPGLMTDATEPGRNGSAGQATKRRRFNEPGPDDSRPSSTEGYDHWNGDPQHRPGSQAFTSAGDPPPFTSRPEYSNPVVATTESNAKGDSQWTPNESAYPELAGYQQQPYFYDPTTNPATYTSSWPPNETHPYDATGTSTSYSVGGQTSSTAMPYFPPSRSSKAVPAAESVDDSAALSYSDLEHATQHAYSKPSPLVTAAQREAAKQSSAYYFEDAGMHLKIQSLPILDNLASQLIHTISKASYHQIQDLMRGVDSEENQSYKTVKNLFDQTRKVYSRETPFIDAIAIQMFQPNQQEIIRKANIATFISSILGAYDVSFFHLNEFFMETFVPLGHRLLKWQGAIYLELKTQSYISALMNSDGKPEEMLDELFPHDLDAQILTRHPDAPSLSPSENDFIDRSRARKSYLLAEPTTPDMLRELPKKYQWNDFVREFASCITKNVDGIMNVPARSAALCGSSASKTTASNSQDNNSLFGNARAAQNAAASTSQNGKPGKDGASTSKPSAPASTIRQPWTKPEEDALLAGLDRVHGPHWSQILALYGRGGSVSEVLKDRNQVQLKDKARNLKLWYLKTGKQVPSALQGVTGELRKRGGARARAALGADDEQAAGGDEAAEVGVDPSLAMGKTGRGSKKKSKR